MANKMKYDPKDITSVFEFFEYGVPVASVQKTSLRVSRGKSVEENEGILLANSEVPKFVYPTCLPGREH